MIPISHTAPSKTLHGTLILFLLAFVATSPDVLSAGNQENDLVRVIQVRNELYMDAYLADDAAAGNETLIEAAR